MANIIDKISYWIDEASKVLMNSFLIIMTVVLAIQVFLRYFLHMGIIWSDELARFAMVALVYIGASSAIRDNSHIKVSVLEDWKPSLRKWLGPVQGLVVVIYSVFLIKFGFDTLKVVGAQNSANMGISMGWVYMVIPLSAVFMVIHLIGKIGKKATTGNKEEN